MENRAPIMVDGVVVGYLSLSWSEEIPVGMGLPPSVGLAGMSAASAGPGSGQQTVGGTQHHQRRLGGDHGSGSGTHHHVGGPREHARHRVHEQHGQEPVRHGPTFRRGVGPGSDQHDKAPGGGTFPTIKFGGAAGASSSGTAPGGGTFPKIVKDGGGEIDRSHHRAYLEAHPETREKMLSIMKSEQGTNREGTQAIAEETFNRGDVRGHSLERVARWTSEPGGYYDDHTGRRGRVTNPNERAILNESLDKALAGSNINKWATDNSSGALAAKEKQGREFTHTKDYTGESFFTRNSERAAHEAWKQRQLSRTGTNAPSSAGIATQARPSTGTNAATSAASPDAMNAPSGAPSAFIVHHTGGRNSPESVVEDWRRNRPGVGTQYIMDREGVVHDVAREYGYHGHGHFLHSAVPGVSNRTAVGMEIVAKDDADITAKQRENAIKFIQSQYPNTTPYGHSEVSPSDRTNEGVDIARTIRQMRANQPATTSSSSVPAKAPFVQHNNVVHIKPGDPLPPPGQPYTVDIDQK